MQKVEMLVLGSRALVDADQVNLHTERNALVTRMVRLNQLRMSGTIEPEANAEAEMISRKIISLNRKMRRNVAIID